METKILIKQKPEEIIIKINEQATQAEILKELGEKLPRLKQLYKEDKTPITIVGKELKENEAKEIESYIKQAINVEITIDTHKVLGLHGIKNVYEEEIETSQTKYYHNSLRSGQKIEYKGSIVVIGDVNAGAEVIAGENIIVLGALRGLAHAGAKGNKKAIIAATKIESVQIRIANKVKKIEATEIKEAAIKTYAYIKKEEIELVE